MMTPSLRQLSNQLRYVIVPQHRSKLVAIQIWVKVGSIHEKSDEFGIAHFIEHMLFKGTGEHDVGEVSALIEKMGGDINAYTTFDHTVIHATVLSEHAAEALLLLKQAVMESVFDHSELENERGVIIEEIKRSMDDPGSILGHTVMEQVYPESPFGRPIFGSIESVQRITAEQILNFHRRWYRPDNMFVVVCGDVDQQTMDSEIHKVFGGIKSVGPLTLQQVEEGEFPRGTQIRILRSETQLPRIEVTLPAPNIEHSAAAALNLICFMIGHSENGPLAHIMRDQMGIVSGASCNFHLSSWRGMISFSFVPEPDRITEVIAQTKKLIHDVAAGEWLSESALKTAKANYLVDRVHEEETVDGLARTIGACLLTDYGLAFEDLFQVRTINCQRSEILAAAARWFQPHNVALVVQIPDEINLAESMITEALDGRRQKPREQPTNFLAKSHVSERPQIVSKRLGAETTLGLYSIPDSKLVSLVAAAPGGLRFDGPDLRGMQYAVGSLLAISTKRLNSAAYSAQVESWGATISGFSGKDSIGIRAQVLQADFSQMTELLIESLFDLTIEVEKLETFRRQTLQTIAAEGDSPAGMAMRRFQERIFPNHAYRFPLYGSKSFIESLQLDDVINYARSYLASQHWFLSVAGGVTEAEATEFAKQFDQAMIKARSLHKATGVPRSIHAIASDPEPKEQRKEQVHVVTGGAGVTWTDSARPVVDVLTAILGGAGGTLFIEMRDKHGLVYTVSPFANHGYEAGVIGIYFACQPRNVTKCKEIITAECIRLGDLADGSDELDRAKQFILGSHETEFQRTEAIAMNGALMSLYGLGPNEFERYRDLICAVTASAVRRVAKSLFDPAKWVTVEVGGSG